MSEKAIQEGIQDALQAMTEFADADIVINDWGIFDDEISGAPYVLIVNADDFHSVQNAPSSQEFWNIFLILVERFVDWKETYDGLRDRRQAIIDKINSGNIRSAGGLEATTIDRIASTGPITPWYDPYTPDDEVPEALPIYLLQTIVLECEEF